MIQRERTLLFLLSLSNVSNQFSMLFLYVQVWWGVIKEGEAPKQIIEDGEFFVLKRLPSTGGHH